MSGVPNILITTLPRNPDARDLVTVPLRDALRNLYARSQETPDDPILKAEMERLNRDMSVRFGGRKWRRFVARVLQ